MKFLQGLELKGADNHHLAYKLELMIKLIVRLHAGCDGGLNKAGPHNIYKVTNVEHILEHVNVRVAESIVPVNGGMSISVTSSPSSIVSELI